MIVLDTQSVVWLIQETEKLSKPALQAVITARREGTPIAISDLTLWEFAMLAHRGRIALFASLPIALQEIASIYTVLPIIPEIAGTSVRLSAEFPADPADRIIAATALAHSAALVTADSRIRRSGEVPCIW